MQTEWTLTALYQHMIKDLAACQSDFERQNCRAICSREIKKLAKSLNRKLTPGEISVLANI